MNRHWDSKERELDRSMNDSTMLQKYQNVPIVDLQKLLEGVTKKLNSITFKTIALDDVIEFKTNGFTVNIDAMASEQIYRFKFESSVYEMYRNNNDELVMGEISSTDE